MKIRTAWRLAWLLPVLLASEAMPIALAESDPLAGEQLTSKIDYRFVGHREQRDGQGRLLVWEASAAGDLNGTIRWWFVEPPPVADVAYAGGRLSFYAARWEFWVDNELLLAGETAGKTDFRSGAAGIWDGHGRVSEANGRYRSLQGRMVYETGPVVPGSDPPMSLSGTGMFVIF